MHIDLVESIQRRYTKRIPGLHIMDLVMVYKLLYGLVDCDYSQFFSLSTNLTRGNSLRLVKNRFRLDVIKFFFANRVVDIWNSLPDAVVLQPSLRGLL